MKELKSRDFKKIPIRRITKLHNDAEKYAKEAHLVYMNDSMPGITRQAKGKGFIYLFNNKQVTDEDILLRIKKLVIPPAWMKVWICAVPQGHLQATGFDSRNRKQYKYHPLWDQLRNETKFHRLLEFADSLPGLRAQVEKDINKNDLSLEKIIATVIRLMERTSIRIGNTAYEKEYGSYGLTTLKNKHVQIKGSKLSFSFKGKKGIQHAVTLRSKKLARIVRQCKEIPGKELFQYFDEKAERQSIDSGKVNAYIKDVTGKDFTAKDFRTWAGTVTALHAFKNIENVEPGIETKKKITEVIEFVSKQLGNTIAVCRKYYVHPVLIRLYEEGGLRKYIDELDLQGKAEQPFFTSEEEALVKILKSTGIASSAGNN